MMPGRRKSNGETLCDSRMPLQPPPNPARARSAAARNHFHFPGLAPNIDAMRGMIRGLSGGCRVMLVSTARHAFCCALVCLAGVSFAADTNSFPARAERAFAQAQQAAHKEPL